MNFKLMQMPHESRAHSCFSRPEELRYEDAPRPTPKAGEVRSGSTPGVNPADWKCAAVFSEGYPLPLTWIHFSGRH